MISRTLSLVAVLVSVAWPIWPINVAMNTDTLNVSKSPNAVAIVSNPSKHVKAVEVQAFRRHHDTDGRETLRDAEDDFIIAPTQFIIPSGEEQVITVRWIGQLGSQSEIPFRVVIAEVPIKGKKDENQSNQTKGSVKIVMKFIKSLYVVNKSSLKSNIIGETLVRKAEKGANIAVLTIRNEGQRHQVFSQAELDLSHPQSDKPIRLTITPKQFNDTINVLAGDTRRVKFPWPKSLPHSRYSVQRISVN